MERRLALFGLFVLNGAACNSNKEQAAASGPVPAKTEPQTSNISNGKTYLPAEINGKAFISGTAAAAIDTGDGYLIGRENNEFVLSIRIPNTPL